jgi:hypothetical protein
VGNDLPPESYVLEIDGIMKSEHRIFVEALKVGLELKQQYPHSTVKLRGSMRESVVALPLAVGSGIF